MMKFVDLREVRFLLPQYVELRNRYKDLLLTKEVMVEETVTWLQRENVEVRCLIQDDLLLGVVVLYPSKDNEITFFVREPGKGVGSRLLEAIENVADEKGIKELWAWVSDDNLIAQRVFEKNGFVKEGINEREYKGLIRHGIKYKKVLIHDPKR